MRNLANEKLVWTTEEDLKAINLALNIAQNVLAFSADLKVYDLDGDLVPDEHIERWREHVGEGIEAILRTKYVPEETLLKLRLVLLSD